MNQDLMKEFKADLKDFREMTEKFYAKEVSVKDYKGFSGGFGSYAQKGGEASMLRLRMPGGRVTKEKLKFLADSIERYDVKRAHIITCQTVQFHDLDAKAVCDIMEQAMDAGIVTRGGGGDFPRNTMVSPLSGVEQGEYFDVLPYAEEAGDYLMGIIKTVKLPRKLKVGFSNTPANLTHATFRDLGFAAREDGTFDVYSAGGLGNNPAFGVKVAEKVEKEKLEKLAENLQTARGERAKLLQVVEQIPEMKDQIGRLTEQRKEAESSCAVLDKTLELMETAKNNLSNQYVGGVERNFAAYMQELLGSDFGSTLVDHDLTIHVDEKGEAREIDYFSAGTIDSILLCMRLALVDALFKQEKPFILLDDPFVNLDE